MSRKKVTRNRPAARPVEKAETEQEARSPVAEHQVITAAAILRRLHEAKAYDPDRAVAIADLARGTGIDERFVWAASRKLRAGAFLLLEKRGTAGREIRLFLGSSSWVRNEVELLRAQAKELTDQAAALEVIARDMES
jgi:hypothetical protein